MVQGYAYWFCSAFLTIILCSYIYHLYSSQRKGFDYEKYARLALDDHLTDEIIDKRQTSKKKEKES
ncbi:cytochrome c oxidase, cbb3-type, CcoQ subunit [Helicobacter monodelphidis]|nr:cytochrome c oxidase, cbb3-type, CcoQ subunit [Helicobacter sp. 15-1451]